MASLFNIVMLEDCGSLKRGKTYPVFFEGYDWYRVRCKGHLIYVSKNFCCFEGEAQEILGDDIEDEELEYDEDFVS